MATGITPAQTAAEAATESVAEIMQAVATNQMFQSAMRAADTMNTQESMLTSLTLNSNTGRRKGLEASTEAQNQDMARRPQAVQGLYRM